MVKSVQKPTNNSQRLARNILIMTSFSATPRTNGRSRPLTLLYPRKFLMKESLYSSIRSHLISINFKRNLVIKNFESF